MVRPGGGAFQKALSLPLLRVSLSQARGSPFFKKRPEYFPDSIPAKSTRQRAAQSIGLTAGTILREADANVPPAGGALPGVPL